MLEPVFSLVVLCSFASKAVFGRNVREVWGRQLHFCWSRLGYPICSTHKALSRMPPALEGGCHPCYLSYWPMPDTQEASDKTLAELCLNY